MRRPEFSLYHASGLDSLVGAVKWTPHGGIQDEYVASDLFFVRDHLGSVVIRIIGDRNRLFSNLSPASRIIRDSE